MAFPTFVISRSWVRVPQMAPIPKTLENIEFQGFFFFRLKAPKWSKMAKMVTLW